MTIFSDIIAVIMLVFIMLMLLTAIVNLFVRVPYVPTKKRIVERLINVAELKKGDKVYDLGCGDGRLLLEAEKKAHIEAYGYEAAPIPYLLAKLKKWLTHSHIHVYFSNFFKSNMGKADVIFCYLTPNILKKLAIKLKLECRRGTRIFSHTFKIEGMTPSRVWPKDQKTKMPSIYLYEI